MLDVFFYSPFNHIYTHTHVPHTHTNKKKHTTLTRRSGYTGTHLEPRRAWGLFPQQPSVQIGQRLHCPRIQLCAGWFNKFGSSGLQCVCLVQAGLTLNDLTTTTCSFPPTSTPLGPRCICRVSQDRICTPYMTVCTVNSLPNVPCIHRIYVRMYGFGQPYVYATNLLTHCIPN